MYDNYTVLIMDHLRLVIFNHLRKFVDRSIQNWKLDFPRDGEQVTFKVFLLL